MSALAPVTRDGVKLEFDELPCHGKSQLFESPAPADVKAAVALCAGCPVTLWCEQRRQETVAGYGIAVGVWAGRFYTDRYYRPA